ncbi:MAG: hypothetical protein KKD74_01950 [Bacteroidetes bacterium]|nr:hypothetical protein [Bacteroidota bacterium]
MRKLLKYFLLLLLAMPLVPRAQYFLTGQDPSSIRWSQLRTNNFKLIFPSSDTLNARRLANLTQSAYKHVRFDLNAPAINTSIVLHNYSVISNAMVGWAPRRLEVFHTPPQDGYAQDWYTQLALHELRHVAQLSRVNQGFGKVIFGLFGQQGTAGIFGLYVPFWFVEGDAVVSETAMSRSGRGRSPLFEAGLRAQLLEVGYYLYDKAYFGSYKDFTPDVYTLGYYLVGHNKYKYGPAIWERAFDRVASKPWMLVPFSSGIKSVSGYGKNRLYTETMFDLYDIWKKQYDSLSYTETIQISPPVNDYTAYSSPVPIKYDEVIALRNSIDDIDRIVRLKDGYEKVLFTPGPMLGDDISATDSLVVWDEYQSDRRWSNLNFSVLMKGDIKTGKISQLTRKSRYFSPDISSDNQKIVVTETDIYGHNAVVVVNSDNGSELRRFGCDSLFFQTPVWHPDNAQIVVVVVGKQGKSLILISADMMSARRLIPFTFDDISLSDVAEHSVLIAAGNSGISNIYSVDISDGSVNMLTSAPFGARDAAYVSDNGDIVYANYHAGGDAIVKALHTNLSSVPSEKVLNNGYPLADYLSSMSVYNIDNATITDSAYAVKPYHKLTSLFDIHSWSPFIVDVDKMNIQPGINLLSQNTLSTAVTSLGFGYNTNEQTGKYSLGFDYYGWYPVMNVSLTHGMRRGLSVNDSTLVKLKWWETVVSAGAYVPLNFNQGKWFNGIAAGISLQQTIRKMDKDIPLNFKEPTITSLSWELSAYHRQITSLRDIYPQWGQTFRLNYRHTPFNQNKSHQFYTAMNAYFPGIGNHHGIKLYAAYETQRDRVISYGDQIEFPRGYNSLFYNTTAALKLDYVFPVWYPDWVVPTLFYLKQIRGGLFGDYLYGEGTHNTAIHTSAGLELLTEWHFLNLPFPVTLGGRLAQPFGTDNPVIEFLFGINLSTLY